MSCCCVLWSKDVAHPGEGPEPLRRCQRLSRSRVVAGFQVSIDGRFWVSPEVCYNRRKINLSQVFAGQRVGVKQVSDNIWLVSFMQYDLGYFDDETCRLEPIENPFSPKVLPMSPE